MKILLTLFVLLFSSSVVADDISDFEIEGMSIGDSLLDYMTEEEIITFLKRTRYMYEHLSEDFGEVYIYDGLKTYDMQSQFLLKLTLQINIYQTKIKNLKFIEFVG